MFLGSLTAVGKEVAMSSIALTAQASVIGLAPVDT